MKKFLVMATLLVATLSVSAQDYDWAVGIRGGLGGFGISAKKNLEKNAVEGTVFFNNGYFGIEGDYLWQKPVISEDFHLYYGAGANVGLGSGYFGATAMGVVGLEYRIPINFPLAVSLDYRPGVGVSSAGVFPVYTSFNLGIKYCF